jgi:hypothetical protein
MYYHNIVTPRCTRNGEPEYRICIISFPSTPQFYYLVYPRNRYENYKDYRISYLDLSNAVSFVRIFEL